MSYKTPRRGGSRREITVTFMSGPLDGKTMPFTQPAPGEERALNIGRREGSEIHLPFDSQVSRLHAKLYCTHVAASVNGDADSPHVMMFWLEDQGSRNGTFIEKQVEPTEGRMSLRPGTLFRIGRTWMRLDVPMSFDE